MSHAAEPLRILALADVWQGSNAYAFVRAFRRMGHSVFVLPPENYIPGMWRRTPLRAFRRLAEPILVREYTEAIVDEARRLRPHLFFVFKGRYVHPDAIRGVRRLGAVAVNFYPDVSFRAHGDLIPQALPEYDWVFTTKRFGLADMAEQLGIETASFLPHGYDPEVHAPWPLTDEDLAAYACDVSFIGTWSPKKQALLERLAAERPDIHMRVWGSQWGPARASLGERIEGRHVLGVEYAKALRASKINLGILSEARVGSSAGDAITSRTFHIPATGAFMLHERTDEFLDYFREGEECGCFGDADELVERAAFYLAHDEAREAAARAGLERSRASRYAIDSRAEAVLKRAEQLRREKRA
jgi:glycosyltransferase involved in cell wall biosynthesis